MGEKKGNIPMVFIRIPLGFLWFPYGFSPFFLPLTVETHSCFLAAKVFAYNCIWGSNSVDFPQHMCVSVGLINCCLKKMAVAIPVWSPYLPLVGMSRDPRQRQEDQRWERREGFGTWWDGAGPPLGFQHLKSAHDSFASVPVLGAWFLRYPRFFPLGVLHVFCQWKCKRKAWGKSV